MAESVSNPDITQPDATVQPQHRALSALPPGYEIRFFSPEGKPVTDAPTSVVGSNCHTVILKSDSSEKLLRVGVHEPERLAASPFVTRRLPGGRIRHALVEVEGEAWVLKAYRRGGVVGSLNATRYWGAGRFLQELRVASTAHENGVATADILALILVPAGFGSLRAWMVSRYLSGVESLATYFGHSEENDLFSTAGRLVARMHRVGIDHADLHLGNIVASLEEGPPRAFILDWDRAVCRGEGNWKFENLLRLWRSVEKLRRRQQVAEPPSEAPPVRGGEIFQSHPALRAFLASYAEALPADPEEVEDYLKRRQLVLKLRTLLWPARN